MDPLAEGSRSIAAAAAGQEDQAPAHPGTAEIAHSGSLRPAALRPARSRMDPLGGRPGGLIHDGSCPTLARNGRGLRPVWQRGAQKRLFWGPGTRNFGMRGF